jgi:immunity protein 10 of polymorphic toxin system
MAFMTVRMIARNKNSEFGTDVLGIYEQPDGSGRSIVLDIAHAFSEQDRAYGQDTYSLSLESGATDYAAIVRCEVSGDILTLTLNPDSAGRLGLPPVLRLSLSLDAAARDDLVSGLREILGRGSRPVEVYVLSPGQ